MSTEYDNINSGIQSMLAVVSDDIASLTDESGAPLGRTFCAAVKATQCREVIQPAGMINEAAQYAPYDPRSGFINEIRYGTFALKSRDRLFLAKVHESIHAIQFHKTAAVHTDFFNRQARLILCPRDALILRELMERDAFAKESRVASLARRQGVLVAPELVYSFKLSSVFDEAAAAGADLAQALHGAAEHIMRTPIVQQNGTRILCRDHYHRAALANFGNGLGFRRADLERGGIDFVRLEQADIDQLSSSFGPAMPTELAAFDPASLSLTNRLLLDQLNLFLGINDEDRLPALGEALAARGMERRDFLAQSRGEKAPDGP